jgi:hypothetical protein
MDILIPRSPFQCVRHPNYQPIDQSNIQPNQLSIDQSNNQSINQSVNQSSDQPNDQSINQPFNRTTVTIDRVEIVNPANQSTNQSANPSKSIKLNKQSKSINQSNHQSIKPYAVFWLHVRLTCSVCGSIDWLIGRRYSDFVELHKSISQSINQSIHHLRIDC